MDGSIMVIWLGKNFVIVRGYDDFLEYCFFLDVINYEGKLFYYVFVKVNFIIY